MDVSSNLIGENILEKNGTVAMNAQVLQSMEIPKNVMHDMVTVDGSGDLAASEVSLDSCGYHTSFNVCQNGEKGNAVVDDGCNLKLPMYESSVVEDESGLLQPGEALRGTNDEQGQSCIINVEDEDEDDLGESSKCNDREEAVITDLRDFVNENCEGKSGANLHSKCDDDDVMQLPSAMIKDQTLNPAYCDEEPADSEVIVHAKRTIRSPEKLAAARKAAATAFGFDEPESGGNKDGAKDAAAICVLEQDTMSQQMLADDEIKQGASYLTNDQIFPNASDSTAATDCDASYKSGANYHDMEEESLSEKDQPEEIVIPRRKSRMPKRYLDDDDADACKEKEERRNGPSPVGRVRGHQRKDESVDDVETTEDTTRDISSDFDDSVIVQSHHNRNGAMPADAVFSPSVTSPVKRGRGRPRKDAIKNHAAHEKEPSGRGQFEQLADTGKMRRPGRPKKVFCDEHDKGVGTLSQKNIQPGDGQTNFITQCMSREANNIDRSEEMSGVAGLTAIYVHDAGGRFQCNSDTVVHATGEKRVSVESPSYPGRKQVQFNDSTVVHHGSAVPLSPRRKPRLQSDVQVIPTSIMTKVKQEPVEDEDEMEDDHDEPLHGPVEGMPAAPTVHVVASQSVMVHHSELVDHIGSVQGDNYSFETLDSTTDISQLEACTVRDEAFLSSENEISTQTAVEFVEVQTIYESQHRRSVQTQTDPRLKKKKFGPLGHDMECDTMDLDDEDDDYDGYYQGRRRDENISLFEDSEPRRKSTRRNTEEALKCPFCDRAFIGLVKHIKSKHCDECDYEEEVRNAKWRERIMKVSTGCDETGDTCHECGKVGACLVVFWVRRYFTDRSCC